MTKFSPSFVKRTPILDKSFDEFFNQGLGQFFGTDVVNTVPAVNVLETAAQFELHLAAPGYNKEDFDVKVEKDLLIISVSKEQAAETEGKTFRRREFGYSNFRRSFRLSEHLQTENISAKYDQGILTVVVPKKEEATRELSRKIDIA